MKATRSCSVGLLAIVFVLNTNAQVATGVLPFNSYGGGPFDVVNLGNLNVHFSIPVLQKAGRGKPFTYDVSFDNSIWRPVTSGGTGSWQPATLFGWTGLGEYQGDSYLSIGDRRPCCL